MLSKKILLGTLASLFLLASIQPASAAPRPSVEQQVTSQIKPSIIGVNYHPMWSSMTPAVRDSILNSLAEAGTQWVRIDVAWGTIQPTGPGSYDSAGVASVDQKISEIQAHGMKVLLMFYWAPQWSSGTTAKNGRPGNPVDYANAAAWVAKRYNGSNGLKIDAMELWNEPDLEDFWVQAPADTVVSDFAKLIKVAGPAVKAANPSLTVVVGAPASVNTAWYGEFYKTTGIVGTYDALGIHPYQSPGDAPPDAYDANYGQYYMKHIPVLDSLMTANNDPANIWATEFGWSSHDNSTYGGTANTPNWKRGVTEQQQADYLTAGVQLMALYPRVQAAFWYNARNTSEGDAMFDNYGLMRSDFSKKPAYYAFKALNGNVVTAPAAPPNLKATPVSTSSINLTWTASLGATSYIVYRNGKQIGVTDKTSFADTGLSRYTRYTYSLKAANSGGTSPMSATVSATTQRK